MNTKSAPLSPKQVEDLIDRFLKENSEISPYKEDCNRHLMLLITHVGKMKLKDSEAGRRMAKASKEDSRALSLCLLHRLTELYPKEKEEKEAQEKIPREQMTTEQYRDEILAEAGIWMTDKCLSLLLRKVLPYSSSDIETLLNSINSEDSLSTCRKSIDGILKNVESYGKKNAFTPEHIKVMEDLLEKIRSDSLKNRGGPKWATHLSRIMRGIDAKTKDTILSPEQVEDLIDRLLKENKLESTSSDLFLWNSEAGCEIAEASKENCRGIMMGLLHRIIPLEAIEEERRKAPEGESYESQMKRMRAFYSCPQSIRLSILVQCVEILLLKTIPFSSSDIQSLLDWVNEDRLRRILAYPIAGIVMNLEFFCKENDITPEHINLVDELIEKLRMNEYSHSEGLKWAKRFYALTGRKGEILIQGIEAWTIEALADLEKMTKKERGAWAELFAIFEDISGSKPSSKWKKMTGVHLEKIGPDAFKKYTTKWMPLVKPPSVVEEIDDTYRRITRDEFEPRGRHKNILKGLVWCCASREDPDLARILSDLAFTSYKKVPSIGPWAVKVGNACVYALSTMGSEEAISQLAILKVKIKFRTALNSIDKAMDEIAKRLKIPREAIMEMAIPAYGMEEVGIRREQMGDFTAELRVTGTTTTQILWLKSDGKTQKSVPKAVKDDYASDLKELKAAIKDIQKMLPAQRERIDNMYLQRKVWPFDVWRERYCDHPLVGTLARRLIWTFTNGAETQNGIFLDGDFVSADDKPLAGLGAETMVRPWHPINESTQSVLAWRDWLEKHLVQQPFKQAHREIYLLTDAEKNTDSYSNRFAAHILKQHQFNALCGARGWKNSLHLMVDDSFPPASLEIPQWKVRAEFWVEGAGEETNEAGTFLYMTTDQVRFYPLDSLEHHTHAFGGGYGVNTDEDSLLSLADIPPLVLSEVMRDVDLFVGVSSVGNDPGWMDGSQAVRHGDYWHSYSFGDLSATAKTRKEVLERLIPRLKIADRCSFSGKFLVVKGKLRTYKIHLGSGNILMEPNDQYLCIVPKRSTGKAANDKLFLPFEGDGVMSVVLSKAFLLADDTKIKDGSIISQIKN